jgi:hypothetical protein
METNQSSNTIELPETVETISTTVTNVVELPTIDNGVQNVICKTSTDRKPLFMQGFQGGYNNCLRFLHHSVKPIIGVVKYDFSDWRLFPTTNTQAKELAFKWSNSLEKRTDFAGKSVVIFFHLELKTIRVEVKAKTGYIIETEHEVIGVSAKELEKNILPPVDGKTQPFHEKNTERRQRYSNPQSWVGPYIPAYAQSCIYSQTDSVPVIPQTGNKNQFQGRKRFYKPINKNSSQ